jgi:hypothetical protein
MTVTLSLRPETEKNLREQAAHAGMSLEAYLERLVVTSAGSASRTPEMRTPGEWIGEWRAWAASHRALAGPADDGRESIYADRGE